MKKNYLFGFLVLFISGCFSGYKYRDISKFNMKPGALQDGEEIKLIYSSHGPGYNEVPEYYIHLIVVSQKTGDTVNVFTMAENGFKKGDGNKIFNYFGPENLSTKIMQLLSDTIRDIKNIDEIKQIKLKKIDKVARDPEFDYIADNQFPSVIGSIGTITNNEKQ